MKADAIIVSAGKGQRFMEGKKKQFFPLGGKPILAHTLDQFDPCPLIRSILLVVAEEDRDYCLTEVIEKFHYKKISRIIPGGKQRQDSVRNGLEALSEDTEIIAIHDGVRPFVTKEMIEDTIRAAIRYGGAILAMPVKDTIKMVHSDGTVLKTLDRESLYQAQTPQAFQVALIKEAYHKAMKEGFVGTDDASLVERLGKRIHILPGSYTNIKITTLEDLMLANIILKMRAKTKGEKG